MLLEFLNGCSSGGHAALGELLQSLDYANQLELSEWDFAVDLSSFHRLNLSDSDLRWLISTGYVRHAIEKTSPADDFRRFVNSKTLAVGRKSCFVLTEKGAAASRAILKHLWVGTQKSFQVPCQSIARYATRLFATPLGSGSAGVTTRDRLSLKNSGFRLPVKKWCSQHSRRSTGRLASTIRCRLIETCPKNAACKRRSDRSTETRNTHSFGFWATDVPKACSGPF